MIKIANSLKTKSLFSNSTFFFSNRIVPIILHDITEGMAEAKILEWKVKVGDYVDKLKPVVEIETDKLTTNISSPVAGTIHSIKVKHGEMCEVAS